MESFAIFTNLNIQHTSHPYGFTNYRMLTFNVMLCQRFLICNITNVIMLNVMLTFCDGQER